MKELTITRHNWTGRTALPGEGRVKGGRLHNEGNFCCLGFYCLAKGQTVDDLGYSAYPNDPSDSLMTPQKRVSDFAYEAAIINDNHGLNQKQKEQKLIAHFATAGITLNFID